MNTQPKKSNIEWSSLGFDYYKCQYRFQAIYKNSAWSKGELITDENVIISEGSTSLHYAQECFEGLKAKTTKDGSVNIFRPDENCKRMASTAKRLQMPEVPMDLFLQAVEKTIAANYADLPPYGYGASMYIRPMLIGIGHNLGIKPASQYMFRVFCSPVGAYYKSKDIKPISLKIADFDRAAPRGIGGFKAGANYAAPLLAQAEIKSQGYDEVLFLDPAERKYIEEAGSANVLVYFKDKSLATPKAETILPSITRKSALTIAKDFLKLETAERAIDFYKEVNAIEEMANCGTAAVIAPVGKVMGANGKEYRFYNDGKSSGPVMLKIRQILTDIQEGVINDPYGWNFKVEI